MSKNHDPEVPTTSAAVADALHAARKSFLDHLPQRIQAISDQAHLLVTESWDLTQIQLLHRRVHDLTGSAGTFGMAAVSESAQQLESRLAALLAHPHPIDAETLAAVAADTQRLIGIVDISLRGEAPQPSQPRACQPAMTEPPLIYVVEDDPAQGAFEKQVLEAAGYRVRHFTALREFRAACTQEAPPAAIIMDMIFPEDRLAGAMTLNELKDGPLLGVPILLLSVRDDLESRLAAYRAGATRYVVKPLSGEKLLAILDRLTVRTPAEPYRVMLVDDEISQLEAHAAILRQAGMRVRIESDPLQALTRMREFDAEVLLLDVYMPACSGPELAAVLREQSEYATLPILFLSAETDMSRQLMALDLGGDDFLVKPIAPAHLIAAVKARAHRSRDARALQSQLRATLYEREREHLALDQHVQVSISDIAGDIIYANDLLCESSGYNRRELLGRNHRLLKSGEHPDETYQALWDTISSGQIWHGVLCNRHKNGSQFWCDTTIVPFLDVQGHPYQYVAMQTDITALKQHEATMQARHSEQLEASEFRYRELFRHALSAVVLLHGLPNPEGGISDFRILDANPALHAHAGVSPEKIVGHTLSELLPDLPQHPEFPNLLQVALHGESLTLERELPGTDRHFRLNAFRLSGDRIAVTFDDISEQKRVEKRLHANIRELRQWHAATLGREERVLELKCEVNALLAKLGQAPRYGDAGMDDA